MTQKSLTNGITVRINGMNGARVFEVRKEAYPKRLFRILTQMERNVVKTPKVMYWQQIFMFMVTIEPRVIIEL